METTATKSPDLSHVTKLIADRTELLAQARELKFDIDAELDMPIIFPKY